MNVPPSDPSYCTSEKNRWFTEEVCPHEASLRSYLAGRFPAVRDVDDVVQESFVRIWKARAERPILSARAFLFTAAKHVALDGLRRLRRSPIDAGHDVSAMDIASDQPTGAEALSREEKVRLLVEAIDGLSARCREVVILRKLRLLSQKEVAARLGISEKGVEIQLARGLTRCREYFYRRGIRDFFGDET
ncbi:MAG TPA: RNA polymerase sigma factor [Rariglobus sp.]